MKNANMIDGDRLVVDRSIVPAHVDIVVTVVNAEVTSNICGSAATK